MKRIHIWYGFLVIIILLCTFIFASFLEMPGLAAVTHFLTVQPQKMSDDAWASLVKNRLMMNTVSITSYLAIISLFVTIIISSIGYMMRKRIENGRIIRKLYPTKKELIPSGKLILFSGIGEDVFYKFTGEKPEGYSYHEAQSICRRLERFEK